MHVSKLSKSFNTAAGKIEVFSKLSLDFPENRISVLIGPSGCGKTTLLQILSGILEPDEGSVVFDTLSGNGSSTGFSFIFQEPRLLPWMDIYHNIDLILKNVVRDADERRARIGDVLKIVGLQGYESLYPDELSGGMRQRVSIARAFAYPSGNILMDEPLQSLDLKLRVDLIHEYHRLWSNDPRTTVMVTHDIREALLMADVIYLLSERPAVLKGTFTVDVPHDKRQLGSGELTALEGDIYTALGL